MSFHPETKTQIAVLKWLKLNHPLQYPFIIKLDNEGKRSSVGTFISIQCGLHIGASDLFLAYPTKNNHGAFLEIKPDGWKLTKSKEKHYNQQMDFIIKMRSSGYDADLRIGFDSCIEFFDNYLS